MTDRVNTLTVVLERPIRDDDVQPLMAAIRALRGVIEVRIGEIDAPMGAVLRRDNQWVTALGELSRRGPGERNL